MAALNDTLLQREGCANFPRSAYPPAQGCTQCGRPAAILAWIYFRGGSERAPRAPGIEGWVVACLGCHRQADFLPTMIG